MKLGGMEQCEKGVIVMPGDLKHSYMRTAQSPGRR